MAAPPELKTERLVLCEGVEDGAFVRALIKKRDLGAFDVRVVSDLGGVGGVSGFHKALIASVTIRGFRRISRLGLVADSDDHYGTAFTNLCTQITNANAHPDVAGRFHLPPEPYVASGGVPRVTALLSPAKSKKGCLETLLWEAIKAIPSFHKANECAEAACVCAKILSGGSAWPKSKQDKARVRLAIGLANKDNPSIGLGKLWLHYPDLVPLDHKAFDDFSQALEAL